MSDTSLQILLVEDNPGDALLVQEMLSDAGPGVFECRRASALLEALDTLTHYSADVILLDLNLPDSHGLETFTSLRRHVPGVPVVLLTGHDDDSLALSAVEEGAQDYLVKDRLDAEVLIRALRYAVVRQQRGEGDTGPVDGQPKGRIIGVMGAKGGVGATTIACHLAAELQRLDGKRVLLADADLDGGTAGFLMQAKTPYTLLDAIDNVYRLDESSWLSMVCQTAGGVHVLTSPALLGRVDPPEIGRLRHVLRFARGLYAQTIVDLGRLDKVAGGILADLDRLLLVTTSDLMAAHDAGRVAESLLDADFPAEKVVVVHNGASRCPAGLEVLQAVVGLNIGGDLPAADKELRSAYTKGELLEPATRFGQEIARLAAAVSGLAPTNDATPGFSLKSLQLFSSRPDTVSS